MNSSPASRITEQQISHFHDDGYICLRQIFKPEWIEMLRQGLEKSMRQPGEFVWTYTEESDGRHFHNENRRWQDIEEYRQFIFESPVGGIVGKLAGWREACLLFDSAFMRSPGTATRTPWHQDLPYLCIGGAAALVSAWIPLQPVSRDSSLECIRGSHHWNKNFYRLNFDPAGDQGHMAEDDLQEWDELPDIDADRNSYVIDSFDMEPGDCLVIDGNLVHGSAGNLDPDRELAVVTIRLLGDNAVYRPDKPGGVQPDLSQYAEKAGLRPGDPVRSTLFPLVWSSPTS